MKRTTKFVFSAMFASLILLATAFFPFPSSGGYLHIGDAFIYLAACFLPFPYAPVAAGIGGAAADFLCGYAVYIPFTFVIKAVMASFFKSKGERCLKGKNVLALLFAALVNVLGYAGAEALLYGENSFAASLAMAIKTLPGNIMQSAAATLLFIIVAGALDRIGVKKKLGGTE